MKAAAISILLAAVTLSHGFNLGSLSSQKLFNPVSVAENIVSKVANDVHAMAQVLTYIPESLATGLSSSGIVSASNAEDGIVSADVLGVAQGSATVGTQAGASALSTSKLTGNLGSLGNVPSTVASSVTSNIGSGVDLKSNFASALKLPGDITSLAKIPTNLVSLVKLPSELAATITKDLANISKLLPNPIAIVICAIIENFFNWLRKTFVGSIPT